jgi:thymidylate synthase (FAD)
MNKTYVGDGNVELIAGGGRIYTDIAARFVKSERSLDEIIATPYSKELVRKIIDSGHKAAVEFDYFIFGVEGYARVTEVQLVRKRLASYMIKTGRTEKNGKRAFDVVLPKRIEELTVNLSISAGAITLNDGVPLLKYLPKGVTEVNLTINSTHILNAIETWYDHGVESGIPEEELRYLKPLATEFKAIIGMNAHALQDWFNIRCCKNAQTEIRDMANKMLAICKQAAPDLFENAGPNCKVLGYCPENEMQHPDCTDKIIQKNDALKILKNAIKKQVWEY